MRGSGGVFDIHVDGDLVFSKHDEGGFPGESDIAARIRARSA